MSFSGTAPPESGAHTILLRPASPADALDMARLVDMAGEGLSSYFWQAIALPGPVTLALAPYGDHLKTTLAEARDAGHELLLQIPLEPFNYPRTDPGPQTLTVDAPAAENLDRISDLGRRISRGRIPGTEGPTRQVV